MHFLMILKETPVAILVYIGPSLSIPFTFHQASGCLPLTHLHFTSKPLSVPLIAG
jgi:hypothetical protein